MEEFLKDSPSDYASNSTSHITPISNYNLNYSNQNGSGRNTGDTDNSNSSVNLDNGGINNLMLNVGYNGNGGGGNGMGNNGSGMGNNGSVSGKYDDNYQYQQSITNNPDYLSPQFTDNQNFIDQNSSQPGSFNETFLDDFDPVRLPSNTSNTNTPQYNRNLSQHQSIPQASHQTFSNFFNPTNTNNLDDLISPKNNFKFDDSQSSQNNQNNNSFLNPQYFSPKNNSNFNNLNSIAEDNFLSSSLTINESLSGPGSYNDHRGIDILAGNHLSPAQVLPYISPNNYDNSYDTLRSPSFQATTNYMNSPPQFPSLRSNIPIPIKQENLSNSNLISPPSNQNHTSLSPSMNSTNLQSRDSSSTKQLTKEEKLKRRRDFHNQVERRRRDLIKEKIKTLGQIVPPSLLNPPLCAVQTLQAKASTNSQELNDLISSVKVKETKPNKSTILNKSVDYINHLVYVIEKQEAAKKNLLKQIDETQRSMSSNDHTGRLSGFHDGNLLGTNVHHDSNFNPDEFFSEIGDQKNYYR